MATAQRQPGPAETDNATGEAVDAVETLTQPLPLGALARLGEINETNQLQGVAGIRFSPNSRRVATRHTNQVVRVWELPSGQMTHEFNPFREARVDTIEFTPDSDFLLIGTRGPNESSQLWSLKSSKLVQRMQLRASESKLQIDGLILAAYANKLQRLKFVAPGRLEVASVVSMTNGRTTPLAISENGRIVLRLDSASRPTLRVFHHRNPATMPLLSFGIKEIRAAAIPPFSDRIAVVTARETAYQVWESPPYQEVNVHERAVQDVEFSPDGRFLASASWDGTVQVVAGDNANSLLTSIEGHGDRIVSLAFSPDGRFLATGSSGKYQNNAIVWDFRDRLFHRQKMAPQLPFEKAWKSLAARYRGTRIQQALFALIESGDDAVDFLRHALSLQESREPQNNLAELFAQLDDDDFEVRERAYEMLYRVRQQIRDQLAAELRSTRSEEVRLRLSRLMANVPRRVSGEDLRRLDRVLFILENINTRKSRQLIADIANQQDDILKLKARATERRMVAYPATDANAG